MVICASELLTVERRRRPNLFGGGGGGGVGGGEGGGGEPPCVSGGEPTSGEWCWVLLRQVRAGYVPDLEIEYTYSVRVV